VLFRSLDRTVTQARGCAPRIVLAIGLSILSVATGPLGLVWAADPDESPALIATVLSTDPLQLDGSQETADETPPIEETAPAATPVEIVAGPGPDPEPMLGEATPAQTVEAAPPSEAAQPAPSLAPITAASPPAAPAPSVTRPSHGVGKYTVARGDTMFSIAKKVELSLGVLSAVNNISDPGAVKAGQTLYIPAQPGSVHVAARGETIQAIAEKYKTAAESVREANRLDKDAKLTAGQLVLIPGVVPTSATAMKPFTASPSPQRVSAAGAISPLPSPKSAQAAPAPPTLAAVARAPQAAGGDTLIWPVTGPLSTNFSPAHRGLDVVAYQGVPVKAALAGRVVGAAEGDGPYGWFVIVEHGGSFTTVYAHLSKIRVKIGDILQKNQVLGEVGSTGQSTGAHLHFELRQGNVPIDPRPYLP
jgi:lipoprotein NlpD